MPAQQRALLLGLLVVVTAVAFEAQAVTTAMPAAAQDLGQVELYAWVFTATVIPMMVATVMAGRLADRLGPARPLVGGLALFAVGTALAAAAISMPMLLAGRFVQGFGGGAVNLSLMVITGLAFSPARRPMVITWFSVAWMLPSFVGPAVAAWLSETFSWHWVFWAVLPFALVGGAVVIPSLRNLPQTPPREDRPAPIWAGIAAAAGTAVIQAGGQALAWWSIPVVAAGLALLVVGAPRLMPAGVGPFARGLPAAIWVRALSAGSFFGVQSFLPLMFVTQHGVSLFVAGAAITLSSLGWMAGSWLQSRPWLRLRRDQIVTAGATVVAAGVGVTALGAATGLGGIVTPTVGMMITGLGMGLQSASTTLTVMHLSLPSELGHNTSALQVGEMLGNALLVGLAGTVFAALRVASPEVTYGAVVLVMAAPAVASALVSLRIGPVDNHATVAKP